MSATKLYPQASSSSAASDKAATGLRVDAASVRRGGRLLFRNVSFNLQPGSALVLTGPNGCGKTSLLRALGGALPLASGQIHRAPEQSVSYMPADDALWQGTETAAAALRFWARLAGVGNVDAALTTMDIPAHMPLSRLSAGQKRRLSFARVLVQGASLWLLDEPLTTLDATARDALARALEVHVAAGGMAVVASHDPLPVSPQLRLATLDLRGFA